MTGVSAAFFAIQRLWLLVGFILGVPFVAAGSPTWFLLIYVLAVLAMLGVAVVVGRQAYNDPYASKPWSKQDTIGALGLGVVAAAFLVLWWLLNDPVAAAVAAFGSAVAAAVIALLRIGIREVHNAKHTDTRR